MALGAKSLNLRGSNQQMNMITSNLNNDANGNALSVTIDGGATWVLAGVVIAPERQPLTPVPSESLAMRPSGL